MRNRCEIETDCYWNAERFNKLHFVCEKLPKSLYHVADNDGRFENSARRHYASCQFVKLVIKRRFDVEINNKSITYDYTFIRNNLMT